MANKKKEAGINRNLTTYGDPEFSKYMRRAFLAILESRATRLPMKFTEFCPSNLQSTTSQSDLIFSNGYCHNEKNRIYKQLDSSIDLRHFVIQSGM